MKPFILCDKTTVQTLHSSSPELLHRYFSIVLPSVIVQEVQGDLVKEKKKKSDRDSISQVKSLARRLASISTESTMNFRALIVAEIQGHKIPFSHRPVPQFESTALDSNGNIVGKIADDPFEKLLHDWREDIFTRDDFMESAQWRAMKANLDWRDSAAPLLRYFASNPRHKRNLAEVDELAEDILALAHPEDLLEWLIWQFGFTPVGIQDTLADWRRKRNRNLDSTPYTRFCIKTSMLAHLGMHFEIPQIGGKRDNIIDLQYLLYLPFCQIFSSADNFQIPLAAHLMTSKQRLVTCKELMSDFQVIESYLKTLSKEEKDGELLLFGPPEKPESLCSDLWRQFRGHEYRSKPKLVLTETQLEEIMGIVKQATSASDQAPKNSHIECNKQADVVWRERTIHSNDPCPCRSGKAFKECHGIK